MTTFTPSFLDEIRMRLPLSGVIGARLRLVRAGREYKGCCPFHNEKTPSFYVNDDKQFFHCFGCGAHGDVIGFTMRHDQLSFPEAVESLAGQAGLQMPRDTPMEREKYDREKKLYNLLDRAAGWFEEQLFSPCGREALAYLHGRGLSDDAIRRYRLGYAPSDGQSIVRALTAQRSGDSSTLDDLQTVGLIKKAEDRSEHYSFFRNRVMFPVGDARGRTVAFGARVLGEGEPKYLNSPDHILFHKGKLLYGLSRARAAVGQGQSMIVVEGYMDVIALAEAGFMGAVAPLGTALTEDQMLLLWKLLPPPENREAGRDYSPIICFDGDNAGQRAALRSVERALPLLTFAQTLRFATISGAKDPDELIRKSGKGAFDAVLKQALPMIDMVWTITTTGRALRTPEERVAFKDVLRRRLLQIKNEELRHSYGAEFKKRIDVAFGLKSQPPNAASSFSKKGWKNNGVPGPTINRTLPHGRQRQMEKILLAHMINHPDLFDSFGENLSRIDFVTPEFDAVRHQLITYLSQPHEAMPTAEDLRLALITQNENRIVYDNNSGPLDEILSPETYLHARGSHPGADAELARQSWRATWDMHEQDLLKAELEAAKRRHFENPSDENWRKITSLQAQIQNYQRTVGEG